MSEGKIRIHEDSIPATIEYGVRREYDSYGDNYYIKLSFDDPTLNPPITDQLDGIWEITEVCCWGDTIVEKATKAGNDFYDFLMQFRTQCGHEKITSQLVQERNAHALAHGQLRLEIARKDARLAELETDYVKKLEADIALHKGIERDVAGAIKHWAENLEQAAKAK